MSPATKQEIEVCKLKLIGLVILGAVAAVAEVVVLCLTGVPA